MINEWFALDHDYLHGTYDTLVSAETDPSPFIVSLSGGRAAGTSTHARDLAVEFGFEHVDNGTVQRTAAEEHGYDDAATFREEHPDADLIADATKLRRAYSGEPLVAEGRLDGAALSADRGDGAPIAPVRIKLETDPLERGRRYAVREHEEYDAPEDVPAGTAAKAYSELHDQDARIYDAFAEVYDGLDPQDESFYTHTVDNTGAYRKTHRQIVSALLDAGFPLPRNLDTETVDGLGP